MFAAICRYAAVISAIYLCHDARCLPDDAMFAPATRRLRFSRRFAAIIATTLFFFFRAALMMPCRFAPAAGAADGMYFMLPFCRFFC